MLPVIVRLAVQFGVPRVAGMAEQNSADAAGQAMFVPTRVRHPHQVPIVDLLAAALAHLVRLLAFYQTALCNQNNTELNLHKYCRTTTKRRQGEVRNKND